MEEGDLELEDLAGVSLEEGLAHFAFVAPFKPDYCARQASAFADGASARRKTDFDTFCHEQAGWLDDFALFCALRRKFGDQPWQQWPSPLRERQPDALEQARAELADNLYFHRYSQFVFF